MLVFVSAKGRKQSADGQRRKAELSQRESFKVITRISPAEPVQGGDQSAAYNKSISSEMLPLLGALRGACPRRREGRARPKGSNAGRDFSPA